jgi:hypothetical protein
MKGFGDLNKGKEEKKDPNKKDTTSYAGGTARLIFKPNLI